MLNSKLSREYLVRFTSRAERDFAALFDEIRCEDSSAALQWYRGLKKAILSLARLPDRCPLTTENPLLRQLLYGRKPQVYHVIYRVIEQRVEILHIRHGARDRFQKTDLES